MAAAVESPVGYPESPLDHEEVVYPCKGCGEILEEGKAFELAGNRWHIDCFRCNTCNTLLDSDANLLLLGDGSLICNNCTYSCNACGNKIEDLAILTGDQAFCSGCFRCRNCKRKIENLRYARTSQGIFCMSCHESLMARRRKKSRTPKPQTSQSSQPGQPREKALPSLPPGAMPTVEFSPGRETPDFTSEASTPQQRSPRASGNKYKRDASPLSEEIRQDASDVSWPVPPGVSTHDGPTLPASTYGDHMNQDIALDLDDDEGGFLPMVFDPTPLVAPQSQPLAPKKQGLRSGEASSPMQKENQPPREYFPNPARLSAKPAPREGLREQDEQGSSSERERDRLPKASPHILSQDKGRQKKRDVSGTSTPATGSMSSSPVSAAHPDKPTQKLKNTSSVPDSSPTDEEIFKLGEVPKSKKARSRAGSKVDTNSSIPASASARDIEERSASPASVKSQDSGPNPFDDPRRKEGVSPQIAPPARHADRSLPLRGDSLAGAAARMNNTSPPSTTGTTTTTSLPPSHNRNTSLSSVPTALSEPQSTVSRDDSWRKSSNEAPPSRNSITAIPPRSASRPSAPSKSVANDHFIAPRAPPAPPGVERHRNNASISTLQSEDPRASLDAQRSPGPPSSGLPKFSGDEGFSMDDEMRRILRGDKKESSSETPPPSVLRRVSNAVKHGRSFSDRSVGHMGKSSPPNGSIDINSPLGASTPSVTSPTGSLSELEQARAQLQRQKMYIATLEAEKMALQEQLNSSSELKTVNTELKEKRSTIAILDTQREMVVRELEVMTDHLAKAKDSGKPLDYTSLKTNMLKDYAESLQKLKDGIATQIEELVQKRNTLTEDIGNLIQMKDKGFQEYENLSTRNEQLARHNDELSRTIQGAYKNGNGASSATTNGLGIYSAKTDISNSSDSRNLSISHTDMYAHEADAEPATVLTAPQVVNIRKGAVPKKFNWRRGGEKMAKNVTKGLKGAFVTDKPGANGAQSYSIGMPYGATQQAVGGSELSSLSSGKTIGQGIDDGKAGFGFFGQKNGPAVKTGTGLGHMKNNSSTNVASSDGSVLFGSELVARCTFENRLMPNIVAKCIAQVERRGMDVEGVYRKSGGAGQVKSVQQGFEQNNDHDLSDPDIDIHAVTSALKQYFRKLPTPLIPYDVYDSLLDAGQILPVGYKSSTGGAENGDSKDMKDKERQQILALRAAVDMLPEAHRNTLHFLIHHLANVMHHEPENLMTPLNLAVVFAPTIMRPRSIEREMSDMQAQRMAVQALLESHEEVFAEE